MARFLVAALLAVGASGAPDDYTFEDYIRVRCSLDGEDEVFFEFNGTVFAEVPGEEQKQLFNVVALNVGRCLKQADGSYMLTTRELLYYLDPDTNEKINRWTNPWTNETVVVGHCANDPVQIPLFPEYPALPNFEDESTVMWQADIPLFYPNELAGNKSYAPYSPWEMYQATEHFHFEVKKSYLKDKSLRTMPEVHFAWFRTSQMLPWMKMGNLPGMLIFSSYGAKMPRSHLAPLLQKELKERIPLFANAPQCVLETPNDTSWSYFKKNFEAYLKGEEFPILASKEPAPCKKMADGKCSCATTRTAALIV